MSAINPVLRRELVERWRGRRAVATITGYLAALGAILYLLYRVGVVGLRSQFGFGLDTATAGPALGRFLFENLLFFVLLLVLFVSPGYAAAQLSGERERRTLPLLQLTLLRPYQIVLGKLGASVAWLTLLVTAALPLGAATLFLGGVALSDLLVGMVFILVVAVGVAGIALGISSLTRRTAAAVVLTYATVLFLAIGTGLLGIAEFVLESSGDQPNSTPAALYPNPFFGLADAAGAGETGLDGNFGSLFSPLSLLGQVHPDALRIALDRDDEAVEGGVAVGQNGQVLLPDGGVAADPTARRPVWLVTAAVYLVLGALGFLIATRRVRPGTPRRLSTRTPRVRRRGRGRRHGLADPGVDPTATAGPS